MPTVHSYARLLALAMVAALAAGAIFAMPPLPQDPLYHAFADARALCGIDNFWNVASNLPFALVGIAGLAVVMFRRSGADAETRLGLLPLACFFIGVGLVSAGSAHYHSSPDNQSLLWDRLPMTVAFASLLAAMLADRVHVRISVRVILPALIVAGIASLLYWQWGETRGAGDLRPYFLLHGLPMITAIALLVLYPRGRLLRARHLIAMLAFYGAALICERLDWEIYRALNGAISGHSIKHMLAALATAVPMVAIMKRSTAVAAPGGQPPRISSSCSPSDATQGRQPTSQL